MTRRPQRVLAALAAGAIGAVLAAGPAPAAGPVGLTKPTQASKVDVDPGRLYGSPSLAIDPENPMHMAAGWGDLRSRRCGVLRSVDGGATWTRPDASPDTATFPFCIQQQGGVIQAPIAFGAKGMLYMALGGWGPEDVGRSSGAVMVARSANLGDSWETTVVRSGRGKTGEAAEDLRPVQDIAVTAKAGKDDVLYLTFAQARTGFTAPNAAPGIPMVAVSRDGGRTFDEGTNLADKVFEDKAIRDRAIAAVTTTVPAPGVTTTTTTAPPAGSKAATPNQASNFGSRGGRNGHTVAVDGKGNAYVLWGAGSANITPSPPGALFLSKSTDAGRTWTTTQATPYGYDNPIGGPAFAGQQMAVSKEGTIHIVYGFNPKPELAAYGEVYHRASYDGGNTFSPLKDLSDDDPKNLAAQFFPNISVAPNGRVDAVWWDTRDDPGIRSNDVYYAYSTDDGRTWSKNERMTDQSVDRRLGVYGLGYDIAAPPGVASTNAYAVVGWDDTRNSGPAPTGFNAELGGGLQDIYTAAVQFEAIGGGGTSNAAKMALAAVVGIVVVGVVLVVAALAARRRNPPPASTKPAGQKSAAQVS